MGLPKVRYVQDDDRVSILAKKQNMQQENFLLAWLKLMHLRVRIFLLLVLERQIIEGGRMDGCIEKNHQ